MVRCYWILMFLAISICGNAQSKKLKEKICKECFGNGMCIKCDGRGWISHHCMSENCNKISDKCSVCDGMKKCTKCSGTGMNIPKGFQKCFCNGFGIELRCLECFGDPMDSPHFFLQYFCPVCDGKGYIEYLHKGKNKRKKCTMCHGKVAYIKPQPLCNHFKFKQLPHKNCQGKGYVDALE